MLLMTAECGGNWKINDAIIKMIESIKDPDKERQDPSWMLFKIRDFYWNSIKKKWIKSFLFIFFMGFLNPLSLFSLDGAIEKGDWGTIAKWMLIYAIIGPISGFIEISMNGPVIFHSFSYTFGGIALICIGCYEYYTFRKLDKLS